MFPDNVSISLKNFKSLKEINNFKIRPLTFLFGKNGSGKNSFIQSLLFLSHNIQNFKEERDYRRMERVNSSFYKSNLFDLIDFDNIKGKYSSENYFSISLTLPIGFETYYKSIDEIDISWIFKNVNSNNAKQIEELKKYFVDSIHLADRATIGFKSIEEYSIEFKFSMQKDSMTSPVELITIKNSKNRVLYQICPNKHSKEAYIQNDIDYSFFEVPWKNEFIKNLFKNDFITGAPLFFRDAYEIDKEQDFQLFINVLSEYLKEQPNEIFWLQSNDLEKEEIIKEIIRSYFLLYFNIPQVVRDFILDISYVPSLRETPKSFYLSENDQFEEDIYYGLLYDLDEKTKFKRLGSATSLDLIEFINKYIRLLKLGDALTLESKNKGNELFAINIIEKGHKINISQSSSGFKQLLPIIYKSYYDTSLSRSRRFVEKMCIIEQPELHLHPSLQASMVEMFLDDQLKHRNFIIETHSEHIIRKVQVLIAKGELDKDRVAVYYFDKDEKTGNTSIKKMELEDNGFFKEPWPDGFFDDSYNLARELIYARKN